METVDKLAQQLQEPAWVTELRRRSLARHTELPWPHPSDDIWRRIDVSQLDPSRGFAPVEPTLLERIHLSDAQLAAWTQPLADEQLVVRVNGSWLIPPPVGGSGTLPGPQGGPASGPPTGGGMTHDMPQGILLEEGIAEPVRRAIEADGLTDAEQKLSSLNLAFHHDDVTVTVPQRYADARPLRLVRLLSVGPKQAVFPLTAITVGAGSTVTILDEYVSVPAPPVAGMQAGDPSGGAQPHLINGRIELIIGPNATVHYVRLQRWGASAREFLLQRATVGAGATVIMANVNLGAALSKAHLVTRLAGEGATANLYGFVFGRDRQHIDQHTLQDHLAPQTTSDLQFNAALQDESRMTYTGLIRIAKEAIRTQAYQANHNLMLSKTARAETIPMLEILADDVQCKHGASIGPIDDEQAFYLMSRGIAREHAQRLIVMGFIESIIRKLPFAPLQQRLREEIEGGIHNEER